MFGNDSVMDQRRILLNFKRLRLGFISRVRINAADI